MAREQIAGQAERIGRLSAEPAQADDTIRGLEAPRAAPADAPRSHTAYGAAPGEPLEPEPDPQPPPVAALVGHPGRTLSGAEGVLAGGYPSDGCRGSTGPAAG